MISKDFRNIIVLNIKKSPKKKSPERLRKEARKRHQNLSEEEKDKRQKRSRERYQNFSEEEKGKTVNIIVIDIELFLKIKNRS